MHSTVFLVRLYYWMNNCVNYINMDLFFRTESILRFLRTSETRNFRTLSLTNEKSIHVPGYSAKTNSVVKQLCLGR